MKINIIEFHYYIYNQHGKCIQVSANMSSNCSVNHEIRFKFENLAKAKLCLHGKTNGRFLSFFHWVSSLILILWLLLSVPWHNARQLTSATWSITVSVLLMLWFPAQLGSLALQFLSIPDFRKFCTVGSVQNCQDIFVHFRICWWYWLLASLFAYVVGWRHYVSHWKNRNEFGRGCSLFVQVVVKVFWQHWTVWGYTREQCIPFMSSDSSRQDIEARAGVGSLGI